MYSRTTVAVTPAPRARGTHPLHGPVGLLPALFEASVQRFASSVLVRDKREGTWQDTTFADMRTLVHRCTAGLMDLGLDTLVFFDDPCETSAKSGGCRLPSR